MQNKHIRDENIQFIEAGHKYIIKTDINTKYTSVTTWNHSHFSEFNADCIIQNIMKGKNWKEGHKYWGLTPEQIKQQWSNYSSEVSSAGTNLHYNIEQFMNTYIMLNYTHKEIYEDYIKKNYTNIEPQNIEWNYFINFIKDTPNLKPYRTEWTIYNEDVKLAGSIDMVYETPDGTLLIYDWKRCKEIKKINNWNKFANTPCICHLPDTNFWHYTLQLNTYKKILEDKYNKKVIELCLVKLHPDSEENNYELINVPILNKEMEDLFLLKKNA
jgi:hypothetical protein